MNYNIKIFSGRASSYLAKKIAHFHGVELGKVNIQTFSDGEFQPSFEETVRGDDVFIVQSTFPPLDNLFELLMMIDAAKRASAHNIIAVIPYFGFARQDRKDKPRVSIASKLIANLLTTAGASRIITMDLHADQIQGFFEVPVDHIYASSVFIPYIKNLSLENIVVAAPDTGGTKRANAYAKYLDCEMAVCYKHREKANEVEHMLLIGNVKNKNVILIDDIVDTAGTLCKAAKLIKDNGAISVRAICSHPVLSGNAYENIENSDLDELVVTDSIPVNMDKKSSKIKVISIAKLFADIIRNVVEFKSISKHFVF